jgi:DNA-binding response OmpR family regulator
MTRLLFVDDEPTMRLTLSTILAQEGFKVTVASTVPDALALITAEKYDVLLSGLNIGQPGEGFTVVSAMRRVQPGAITLILTGYPAFEAALRAIREQVDDFFTKPTDVKALVGAIKSKLESRKALDTESAPLRRPQQFIAESEVSIVAEWLRDVEGMPQIAAIPLTREERIDHLPQVLSALIQRPEATEWEAEPNLMQAAAKPVKPGDSRANGLCSRRLVDIVAAFFAFVSWPRRMESSVLCHQARFPATNPAAIDVPILDDFN